LKKVLLFVGRNMKKKIAKSCHHHGPVKCQKSSSKIARPAEHCIKPAGIGQG
jgi:hypothetical protein